MVDRRAPQLGSNYSLVILSEHHTWLKLVPPIRTPQGLEEIAPRTSVRDEHVFRLKSLVSTPLSSQCFKACVVLR